MSNNSSTRYHQKNKERLQKKACERYQNLSEDETVKYGKNNIETFLNMKNKG